MLSTKTTISNLLPLYKEGEEASKIELACFSTNNYTIVVGKGMYKIGDEVILIYPDTQLPNTELFQTYIAPEGNSDKSKLGKVGGIRNRVRAIKFNLSLSKDNTTPVYSEGIIIPSIENIPEEELDTHLGLFKEEEPEDYTFPRGLAKTNEENLKKDSSGFIAGGTYCFTEKIDGSSCTILISDEYPEGCITSRSQVKDLTTNDKFVVTAKSLLEYLKTFKGSSTFNNIAYRGECYGGEFNGSGNKLNRMKGKKPSIILYSIEQKDPKTGIYSRIPFNEFCIICRDLEIERVPTLRTCTVNSVEEMLQIATEIFEEQKAKGIIIEGVVVRSWYGFEFSKKILNPEYDSKK